MHIFLTIIVTFLCMPWPAMIMMSPMMIAAPGFANKKSYIICAMLFFIYPSGIFLLLKLTGYSFYGTDPIWWAAAACIAGMLVSLLYQLPKQLYNTWKGISNYDYFITDTSVYFNGSKLKNADAKTFTHFNNRGYYSKDKNQVYYNSKKIDTADAATFQPLLHDDTKSFWHDKNNAYYQWNQRIKGADGASLEYAGERYVYDRKHVFFENTLLQDADRTTFKTMPGNTGKDNKNVFIRSIKVTAVKDPASFEIISIQDELFGKDKNQIYALHYSAEQPLIPFPDADIATFEVIGEQYAKDKNKVYYYSYHLNEIRVLADADPETFTLYFDQSRRTDATDGKKYYRAGILHAEQKSN
ncbi:DKNYY domain-containing protein [Cytophaga hutchinsonii]|uniref:Membrane protein n=1 Tax=Cytophaga hutchinsonii (strain ATCC 33406 / DSM 1761 / CIP 103989 / NBRC 15051 / NCIMB 9469 / D465) TaxID=269798 RepID=A0A6N4SPY2_CYTH3|nr:DKNYY domain-containing protein [Cytophaga hutchinsonii]ABG58395.1 membrane protein [Cytophaga hutchinsonii ATCC 33406]SFX51030.1 DKNYY family protein [Cytophaga hutchinsonii ATCC 33406]